MKNSTVGTSRWLFSVLALALVAVPMAACGGEEREAQIRASGADTLIGAMQQAVPEGQETPRPTSPRLNAEPQQVRISDMGYNVGSADAPVKVLEFSDFGCGYCRRFHAESFPTIKRIYLDGGFVEWKFIPFVLGMFPNGLEAAIASECAGEQDDFFPMQSRLFESQRAWRSSDDPNAFFAKLAGEVGLDAERFKECVADDWRGDRIRANIRLGQQAGVQGTPLFIIDGRILPGALPLENFREILDAALSQRGITPPGG